MSDLSDLPVLLTRGLTSLHSGRVEDIDESGRIEVRLGAGARVACQVLLTSVAPPAFEAGDEVLVWLADDATGSAVVLGKVGVLNGASRPVVPAASFAERRPSMVIETQGELVLRNGQARIRLGAEGDVEIVCNSFVTRSQRLLRLLSPFIKLN